MNREQRRELKKTGVSKENIDKLELYNGPCTILEATQIARASAVDVLSEYNQQTRPLHVALSLQVEALKDILIENGLLSEDALKERYIERVNDFNARQKAVAESSEGEDDEQIEGV